MDEMHKHYQILGLKPEASEKEIVEAYKVLVKVWNPDRFSDDPQIQKIAIEKIKEIDEAFKQLLIPEQTAITEKGQPPASGEKPYGTPTPSLFEPRHEPSSKPFQKEGLKDGIKQTVVSPHIVEYAGFWKRFAALIIDSSLISIVTFTVCFIFGLSIGLSGGGIKQVEAIGWIIGGIISWLYWAILESSSMQATLGKMALGIIVTDNKGRKISFGRATGRYFAKIGSAILLIGFIMAGFTKKKEAIHDMVADTLVVVKKQ